MRVLIADDHALFRDGVRSLLEARGVEVVGEAANGQAAVDAARRLAPDVVLMDLRMPGLSGLDMLRSLSASQSKCRSVLLTAIVRDSEVMEAVKLGVRGIVLKESAPEVLIECVRRVYRGEQWIERETVTRALQRVLERESAQREAGHTLTPREIRQMTMEMFDAEGEFLPGYR